MDLFGGQDLKKLFKFDKVHHDNWLFKLHHQVNFFVIFVGVLFILGENYLNEQAIVCNGGDEYSNQFCWLHGTGHLPHHLAKDITGLCSMDQNEVTAENDKQTHYYLWIPFVLAICMSVVKIPRMIWKNLCERGIMLSLVGEEDRLGEKIAARFKKLHSRRTTFQYHISYAVCEVLNIVAVIICFYIIDALLDNQFLSYGNDVNQYYSMKPSEEDLKFNPTLDMPNPMCNLFPTEVACNWCTGSIGGGCNDRRSTLCILSNNLFNQYYFLFLWWWWAFLLTISCIGLLYRALQMFIPSFSKFVFQTYLMPYGLELTSDTIYLRSSDYFLLGRLSINVKGSTLDNVLSELSSNRSIDENTILKTVT